MNPQHFYLIIAFFGIICIILGLWVISLRKKLRKKICIYYCEICYEIHSKPGECRRHSYPVVLNRGSLLRLAFYSEKRKKFLVENGLD